MFEVFVVLVVVLAIYVGIRQGLEKRSSRDQTPDPTQQTRDPEDRPPKRML